MRKGIRGAGPLPEWARRGYAHTFPAALRWGTDGFPVEPEPNEWSMAHRSTYMLHFERMRKPLLPAGKVVCVLCGGPTRLRQQRRAA